MPPLPDRSPAPGHAPGPGAAPLDAPAPQSVTGPEAATAPEDIAAPGDATAPEDTEGAEDTPTLATVLAAGAGEAVEVVTVPGGHAVPVRGIGVYDPGETFAARDHVLVAIGVDASSPAAADVLRAAARTRAAALVLRRGATGPAPRLLDVARHVPTALLTRAPWVEWTELIALLRAGLAQTGGAEGPHAEVPLGDLPALANAFAALVGGAVTIEDPESRVLAYSRTENGADPLRRLTILGQRVPRWRLAELGASGFLRTLWTSDDVVHRPADARFPERLAIAVRAGEEVLGSLWVAADGAPLGAGARQALREAARTAAPHLLHHRLRTRTGATRRVQAVRALLDGTDDVPSAAATLGLAPHTPCAVLSVLALPGTGQSDPARALHLAALQATAHHPAGLALREEDRHRLDVLLPLGAEDRARTAKRLGRELASAVRGAGARPLVAIGAVHEDLAHAAASRRAAHLVLRVLTERGTPASDAGPAGDGGADGPGVPAPGFPEVAAEDDVRAALDALRVTDAVAALAPPPDAPVRALLAYDEEHRTDLARTLAAYLDRFGDVPATAKLLAVHPNTLRYRLRRLHDLFAIDLADPDTRLLAELGLRAAGLLPWRRG
ncbi:helix-turn-helix domain-containing protein [Streptomyces sp. CA-253872]|uniref:PucR family transcriptional regulator n=1 Tax=Streptomyces sp. CA-253872 TaxID=3240067 RepID=UPI003D8C5DEC